jgi:hypothetical protein
VIQKEPTGAGEPISLGEVGGELRTANMRRLKTNVKRGSKLAFWPSTVPSQNRSANVRPDATKRSSSTAEATRFAAASVVVATLRTLHLSLSILFLQLPNAVDLLPVPITLGFPF